MAYIIGSILALVLAPFLTLGLYLTYCILRYRKKTKGDKTASGIHFLACVWFLTTQRAQMVERIPELAKDWSELYGFFDDGKVS